MIIFSYHLVKIPFALAIKGIYSDLIQKNTKGLIHAEYMTAMTLGSPILSPFRFLIKQVAVFAQWEKEEALENYLANEKFGKILTQGWHVRLAIVREWGKISGFKIPEYKSSLKSSSSPVVAVTIARMKPLAVPRFIHWGRPVEKLVRDHSATLLSLASFRFPNTVSTFSIWQTEKEMTKFFAKLDRTIELISRNPVVFPESFEKKGIRKAVVEKHNNLYYRIIGNSIEILSLFSNRKNPETKRI